MKAHFLLCQLLAFDVTIAGGRVAGAAAVRKHHVSGYLYPHSQEIAASAIWKRSQTAVLKSLKLSNLLKV